MTEVLDNLLVCVSILTASKSIVRHVTASSEVAVAKTGFKPWLSVTETLAPLISNNSHVSTKCREAAICRGLKINSIHRNYIFIVQLFPKLEEYCNSLNLNSATYVWPRQFWWEMSTAAPCFSKIILAHKPSPSQP